MYSVLQAGQTYTFAGTFEDTLSLEVGGSTIFAAGHDGNTSDTETFTAGGFTPTATGYYSVEAIVYNVSTDPAQAAASPT